MMTPRSAMIKMRLLPLPLLPWPLLLPSSTVRPRLLFGRTLVPPAGYRGLSTTTTTTIDPQQGRPSTSAGQEEWPFGLKRVDYSKPPPRWPLPVPPPAPKSPARKYLYYGLVVLTIGTFTTIFMNQDEDIYEYWRQVEQGNVPLSNDDDDDDDDDDDNNGDLMNDSNKRRS